MTTQRALEVIKDVYSRVDFVDWFGDPIDDEPYREALEVIENIVDSWNFMIDCIKDKII